MRNYAGGADLDNVMVKASKLKNWVLFSKSSEHKYTPWQIFLYLFDLILPLLNTLGSKILQRHRDTRHGKKTLELVWPLIDLALCGITNS